MALTSKVLFTFKPVRILVNGTPHKYDSLIFTKVRKMSKYMTIPKKAIKDDMDGTFNVLEFKHGTKLRLLVSIIKASTTGYRKVRPVKSYQFRTIKDTLVQLDGEISHIEPGIDAAVGVEMSALRCIV
jgi:diacylglycerol kinase (ATP)